MAARIRKTEVNERWREKIRISMIINRLTNHILGRIEMSKTQVQAAAILLRKVVPDVAAVEHTGANGGPIQITRIYYGDQVDSAEPTIQLPAPALSDPNPESTGLRH